MERHIRELYNTVRSSSSKDRQSEWHNVEQRLKEQILLRAISCIQVSSKLSTHYKVRAAFYASAKLPYGRTVTSPNYLVCLYDFHSNFIISVNNNAKAFLAKFCVCK